MQRSSLQLVSLGSAAGELVSATALALDDERVTTWLSTSPERSLATRLARDLRGESLHLLVTLADEPLGWAGWLRWPTAPHEVETTTYLAPRGWGSGLLDLLASLQWQVASAAGVSLVSSIHCDNLRSIAARRRCWPDDALWEERWEEHKQRRSWILRADVPPRSYAPLEHPDLEDWVSRCRQIPLR